jgi:hypothetical protein
MISLFAAGPALADTRYWAFDASDRVTQALTRGVTLQVERGFFGGVRVDVIHSTSARGSAEIRRGGPDAVRRALPDDAEEYAVYSVVAEGDGRGLTRALCPGSEEAWLVLGRVRQGRPLTIQAVGRWLDGQYRPCVQLSYTYRGEWAAPPPRSTVDGSPGAR